MNTLYEWYYADDEKNNSTTRDSMLYRRHRISRWRSLHQKQHRITINTSLKTTLFSFDKTVKRSRSKNLRSSGARLFRFQVIQRLAMFMNKLCDISKYINNLSAQRIKMLHRYPTWSIPIFQQVYPLSWVLFPFELKRAGLRARLQDQDSWLRHPRRAEERPHQAAGDQQSRLKDRHIQVQVVQQKELQRALAVQEVDPREGDHRIQVQVVQWEER